MGLQRLRDLVAQLTKDNAVGLEDIEALIAECERDGVVSKTERLTLRAALDAHAHLMPTDAVALLRNFVDKK